MAAETSVQLYALRMGSLAILSKQKAEWDGAEHYQKTLDEVASTINKRVRAAPIVVEEPKQQLGSEHSLLTAFPLQGERRWSVCFGQPLIIKVHWPRKNQELLFMEGYAGPCVEDFEIVYDGQSFVVAGRCDQPLPWPYSFPFGREGRRILLQLIPESDSYHLEGFGPTPIRPIIYVIVAPELPDPPLGRPLLDEGNVRESVFHLTPEDFRRYSGEITRVAETLLLPMWSFSRTLAAREEFLHQTEALYTDFSSCTGSFASLSAPLPRCPLGWVQHAIRRTLLSRTLRRSIGAAYGHYVEVEEARAGVRASLQRAMEEFPRHPLLQPHAGYCKEEVQECFEWTGEHILEALRFFSEEARSRSLESATVFGALVGGLLALAGAVIGFLLAG